ncbi:LysM domain-containing protein [Enterococcus faecalis]|uniref:aggregation-promoting factor n=1 Tax=Enterococcus faecalis TaxID=1351 RepID=UPI0019DC4261|nr:LysM domain-containing protein [Enterococcus faecalis]EGO5990296.1 LysM peptidoglycan-binding domain-containing protein [Enterococcus faecalis]EGO8620986.1 LysM peptidoglycan-binding domain-containing protein [Enterococcus faecalis]WHK28569.1 LysM domain-containing protein [Enterococcus faecalis]WHK92122.1 LysM domain-containing protein [Enterococcus faecalis]
MKSIKTILLGTTLAAGLGLFLGTDANAESLYTVKAGDTLSTISHQFAGDNSLIQKIASDNKLPNLDLIFEGEQLVIRSEKEVANTPAPAVEVAPVQQVVEQPVAQEVAQPAAPAASSDAKEWIAQRESSGSYDATNGQYIGRYQLSASYLNGDYSPANQERVADQYVAGRYGSWDAAKSFWLANGWY